MNYRRNIISGGLIFLFGAVYFALSFQIPLFKGLGSTPIDARFVPQLWGGLLMLLSAVLLVRGFKEKATLRRGADDAIKRIDWRALFSANREVILTFVILTIYIALLKPVGFLIMSTLYITIMAIVLSPQKSKKPWLAAAVTGLVLSVFVDFVFVRLLNVMLPAGILGF